MTEIVRRSAVTGALAAALALMSPQAFAQTTPVYGEELEGFDYPYPVSRFEFIQQGVPVSMAYMDVAPARPNGRAVVLMHGKNFCAATWGETIGRLTGAGYRVVAPDQIGFCKSSKPERAQYSFHRLAANTHALLQSLGVKQASIVGHSMGGMLAARYALSFPGAVDRLVLVNPLGLEDWKAKGVPYASVDQLFAGEMRATAATMKAYQQRVYYSGAWKPEYDQWVSMIAGLYAGPGRNRVAWTQALTSEMIFTQPVVYEFAHIRAPTVLLIGLKDTTAPGADRAPPEIARTLGDFAALSRAAASAIPDAELVTFAGLGHSPHIEAPELFGPALLKGLESAGR